MSQETQNSKSSSLPKLLAHAGGAVLIGVGIVAVFAMGLAIFDNRAVEKENPETAYLIPFPKNEDMLDHLPRQIIEGTGFENIAPAAGDDQPAEPQ